MNARLSLIVFLAGLVLHATVGSNHRALAGEKPGESTNVEDGSSACSDCQRPSITVQDQSRRLLSPGFRLVVIPASETGKRKPELHLEEDQVFEGRSLFRSNEPPLLLKTAAYGLSQAVKLADHKIGESQHPLLIDAGISRQVSLETPQEKLAACKYCSHQHTLRSKDKLTHSSSKEPAEPSSTSEGAPVGAPKESKTVKELVDLMESLGPGVLENSVFNVSEIDSEPSLRQALVQNLSELESLNTTEVIQTEGVHDEVSSDSAVINPWYDSESSAVPVFEAETDSETARTINLRIDALRESAEQLDLVANQLERKDLYYQSDQLRELATQLRSDARNARIALMSQPASEDDLPEVESSEEPLDLGPVTQGRQIPGGWQLQQLLQAARSARGQTSR